MQRACRDEAAKDRFPYCSDGVVRLLKCIHDKYIKNICDDRMVQILSSDEYATMFMFIMEELLRASRVIVFKLKGGKRAPVDDDDNNAAAATTKETAQELEKLSQSTKRNSQYQSKAEHLLYAVIDTLSTPHPLPLHYATHAFMHASVKSLDATLGTFRAVKSYDASAFTAAHYTTFKQYDTHIVAWAIIMYAGSWEMARCSAAPHASPRNDNDNNDASFRKVCMTSAKLFIALVQLFAPYDVMAVITSRIRATVSSGALTTLLRNLCRSFAQYAYPSHDVNRNVQRWRSLLKQDNLIQLVLTEWYDVARRVTFKEYSVTSVGDPCIPEDASTFAVDGRNLHQIYALGCSDTLTFSTYTTTDGEFMLVCVCDTTVVLFDVLRFDSVAMDVRDARVSWHDRLVAYEKAAPRLRDESRFPTVRHKLTRVHPFNIIANNYVVNCDLRANDDVLYFRTCGIGDGTFFVKYLREPSSGTNARKRSYYSQVYAPKKTRNNGSGGGGGGDNRTRSQKRSDAVTVAIAPIAATVVTAALPSARTDGGGDDDDALLESLLFDQP